MTDHFNQNADAPTRHTENTHKFGIWARHLGLEPDYVDGRKSMQFGKRKECQFYCN
ncbi:hypothetical protein [Candidatus Nitrospira allomarina]|uniref:Uncharacterized protein n=1 Tax=Candidatus Nitrospira allomarina TaxID=3020900 RepID=A0AA96GIL5_9BACT|nr:hypothetical protein [Candidatus Nitrospira allomarina]WNM59613.1 hypothetical protein PP769_07625 [Candidatus Nitrospira allomarina]